MTETTRRLREASVVIVDCPIPAEMTIAEYRRARSTESRGPRPRLRRFRRYAS